MNDPDVAEEYSSNAGNPDFQDQHTLEIVRQLCQTLDEMRIQYCHWKSNDAIARSASGDNDLDLLVNRGDTARFTDILYGLGFKRALAPIEKQVPGVIDFFGYDEAADKLVHVHAHYLLVLGHDLTKNYRLPIEKPYLESAAQMNLFKIPDPNFEFIVFVVRMVLKHATWDAILGGDGRIKTKERKELSYLHSQVDNECVTAILQKNLPYIGIDLFNDCLQTFERGTSVLKRVKTSHKLQISLQPYARRSMVKDTLIKMSRRVMLAFRHRILKTKSKYYLESGGALIAIIGGDGAGKSTAVDGLHGWLSEYFGTAKMHMGKPDWSWTSKVVRGTLKIGSILGLYPPALSLNEMRKRKSLVPPEYPWMIREVCTAHDRCKMYMCAQRYAANNNVVLLDRFPHPQVNLVDGPQGRKYIQPSQASKFLRWLIRWEESYYQQVVVPELSIVLRVNPEIAVQRKTNERSSYVRERSQNMWELNWDHTDAHVIEANGSKAEVLGELKTLLWSQL